ncbi:MAG: Gfo/Idh/MocA family oxidoreductase [Candidatus Hydrogenedentes bacterium]|nr:Gfo/Idh/MocA family oxidoreductase [Candidatus Hydrogenedentota bacterium]
MTRGVLGQNAPSTTLAIGVIGTGGRGRSHISSGLAKLEGTRVVAVCDVNAEDRNRARQIADEINGDASCAAFEDFRELLARPDVDAVTIAVPDHWHALIAVAAARAGKHLYAEKPFAYSISEGQAIVDAVKSHGVVFQHGTQQRSDAKYWQACMLVRNGYLGTLNTVRVGSPFGLQGGSSAEVPVPAGLNYDFWLGPAPFKPYTDGRCHGDGGVGWYHIRDYSGGWVTAWGSHDVDIAHWGMGADDTGPIEVSGTAEFATNGVYDTAWKWHFDLAYANGVKIVYASENENPHGVKFEGSEGWIFVKRGFIDAEPKSLLDKKLDAEKIQLLRADNHMLNFLDAIRTGGPVTAPVDAAHRSTAACHLCNIAARTGRKIAWDPAKQQVAGDDEANAMLARPMRAPWTLQT